MRGRPMDFTLTLDGVAYKIAVDGNSVLVNGQPFVIGFEGDRVLVDGTPYDLTLEESRAIVSGIAYDFTVEGLGEEPVSRRAARPVAGKGAITAIMPGKILRILVSEGDSLAAGDVVCILEAMKMENELKTSIDGVVKAIHVQSGQDVEMGALLVEIE